MDDVKYIKLRTKNAKMLMMHGDKLTKSEWLRSLKTNGLHTEVQFSDRYGGISFSSTLSDGCNGCRFKMIGYSHPYRWSTLYIACTAEQEDRLFEKAFKVADMLGHDAFPDGFVHAVVNRHGILYGGDTFYGPNHVKYDKGAAFFSFISKRNIWKASKVNMICNRACAVVLLEGWPDMLDIKTELKSFAGDTCHPTKRLDPARLTPDQLHYQAEYYFERIAR